MCCPQDTLPTSTAGQIAIVLVPSWAFAPPTSRLNGRHALGDQERVPGPKFKCMQTIFIEVSFETQTPSCLTFWVFRDENHTMNLEMVCVPAAAPECRPFSVSHSFSCDVVITLRPRSHVSRAREVTRVSPGANARVTPGGV